MVRHLSSDICRSIVALRDTGMQQIPIARHFGITQGAVSKILKRFRLTGLTTPRPGRGRKLKTDARDDRHLIRLCLGRRTQTASTLRAEWQHALGFRVSQSLVKARLHKAGLYARRPRVKPLLSLRHRQRRLEWAQRHRRIHQLQWEHVIFSDEARFEVYRRDGRIRVRRRREELYHESCVTPRVQAGGGGITVWGCFHTRGKPNLVMLEGNLNHQRYLQILEGNLVPYARETFGENFVFQDDNAPAHRARAVRDFWEENEIQHLDWPACSPDMNPIENLWAEVTRYLNNLQHSPTNVNQLRVALNDAWAAIPNETLASLVSSMPRRIQALLDARGGHTRF